MSGEELVEEAEEVSWDAEASEFPDKVIAGDFVREEVSDGEIRASGGRGGGVICEAGADAIGGHIKE